MDPKYKIRLGNTIYRRMNRLLAEDGRSFAQLMVSCGAKTVRAARWEDGGLPRPDVLAAAAMELRVTCDYLLGRTRQPLEAYLAEEKFDREDIRMAFQYRWQDLAGEEHLTSRTMGRHLGASGMSFYQWANGICMPNLLALVRIADRYDLSVDYLLGLTEEKLLPASIR